MALDTTRMRGPREVRARLLDANRQELACASRPIVFGDAPPTEPRFVDPPTRAWRLAPLRLKARGGDPVTGIQQVVFFVGQPVDGKLPPRAPTGQGRPLNEERTLWEGDLSVPPDHKGPTTISVQFVNALGLSRFDTINVTLEETDPLASRPGRIQGRVLEGNRPQAGLDVLLGDEKGAGRGKAKTDADGAFLFRDVAPGKYRLTCEKASSQRQGSFPSDPKCYLEVAPGESVKADVLLYIP